MQDCFERIYDIGIIPVIALDDAAKAEPLAKALCRGGIPAAEVTFRTAAAAAAIRAMREACPEMLVGAGTVLTVGQAKEALASGAQFIVAPGLDPEIVNYCLAEKVPVIPGVATASDIAKGLDLGLTTLKFFPAEPLGGMRMIKALAAPYRGVRFLPTGGINADNLGEYLADPRIIAAGGTWMIDKEALKSGDFGRIEQLCHQAVLAMLDIHLAHVGLNAGAGEGSGLAEKFAAIFAGSVRTTSKGFFGSDFVEIMGPQAAIGAKGHIALGVSDAQRAFRYFESLGYPFDPATIARDEQGHIKLVYFKDEIGGFRIHLITHRR